MGCKEAENRAQNFCSLDLWSCRAGTFPGKLLCRLKKKNRHDRHYVRLLEKKETHNYHAGVGSNGKIGKCRHLCATRTCNGFIKLKSPDNKALWRQEDFAAVKFCMLVLKALRLPFVRRMQNGIRLALFPTTRQCAVYGGWYTVGGWRQW